MSKATSYFSYFPQEIKNSYKITNLLARANIRSAIDLTQSKMFIQYTISEGERPEIVAERIYGSTTYFWIVLYMNDIKNVYEDWPKTIEVFNDYIISKYGSLEFAQTTVHHFEDADGDVIEEANWDGTESARVTVYEYETLLNDAKRQIFLVRPEYKDRLSREFRGIFKTT